MDNIYDKIIGKELDLTHGPGMQRMKTLVEKSPELADLIKDVMELSIDAMKELRAAEALGLSSPIKQVEPAAEKTNLHAYRDLVEGMSNVDKILQRGGGEQGGFLDRV